MRGWSELLLSDVPVSLFSSDRQKLSEFSEPRLGTRLKVEREFELALIHSQLDSTQLLPRLWLGTISAAQAESFGSLGSVHHTRLARLHRFEIAPELQKANAKQLNSDAITCSVSLC